MKDKLSLYSVSVRFTLDVERGVRAKSENEAIKKVRDWVIKNRKLKINDFDRLSSSAVFIGE